MEKNEIKLNIDEMKPAELLYWVNSNPNWDDISEEQQNELIRRAERLFPFDWLATDVKELREMVVKLQLKVDRMDDLNNLDKKVDLIISVLQDRRKKI